MTPLEQTKALVSLASVSRDSNRPISDYMTQRLNSLGFEVEHVEYQWPAGVDKVNVIARRGDPDPSALEARGLAYFAHSDVVPADTWTGPTEDPFRAEVRDGRLYGRGSCDMKGSIACMLSAIERMGTTELVAPCYFVCTADEEVGYRGAREMVAHSQIYREIVQRRARALIGEPTRLEVVHAHKGICGFRVTARGQAAHSSTRQGLNANLAMIPFLQEMKAIYEETESQAQWQDDEFDPPTLSWNIGINDHTTAMNIKPAQSICTVFFRPLPHMDYEPLLQRSKTLAERHGLEWSLDSKCDASYTEPNRPFILETLQLAQHHTARTVSYGTDGSELTELQDKVVCGPGDIDQAHTSDEWIALEQLEAGTELFEKFLRQWCVMATESA